MCLPTRICAVLSCAVLATSALAQPSQVVFGLPHTAQGNATLDVQPDGTLQVSNIGSSGLDGVSIDLGEAEFHTIQFQPQFNVDSFFDIDVSFTSVQGPYQLRARAMPSGNIGLSADFGGLMPTEIRVEVQNRGEVVADSGPMLPPVSIDQVLVQIPPPGCMVTPARECPTCFRLCPTCPISGIMIADFILPAPGQIMFPGQAPVTGDQVRVFVAVPQALLPLDQQATDIRLTGLPLFTMQNEALGLFGRPHTTLGEAHMTASGGHLVVSNIGSSGCDGVSIHLDDDDDGDSVPTKAMIANIETGQWNPELGCLLEFGALVNSDDGLPPGTPVSATLEQDPAAPAGALPILRSNFSLLKVQTVRVEVRDATGTVVGAVDLPDGDLGTLSDAQGRFPTINKCGKLGGIGQTSCLVACSDFPMTFSDLSGTFSATGSDIRILLTGDAPAIDSLQALEIRARGLSELRILGEAAEVRTLAFGIEHEDIGQAVALNRNGQLVVSNIGSSGKDGVSMDLGGGAVGVEASFACCFDSFFDIDVGCRGRMSARGTVGGGTGSGLGSLVLQGTGTGAQVDTDYSELGATQVRLVVLSDGEIVGSCVVPEGTNVATLTPAGPTGTMHLSGCGKTFQVDSFFDIDYQIDFGAAGGPPDFGPPCFVSCFVEPVSVQPAGGGAVMVGNELRVLADDATVQVEGITRFDIQSTRDFTMTDARCRFPHVAAADGRTHVYREPGGAIKVRNIGSSGLDGVTISSGGSGGEGDLQESISLTISPIRLELSQARAFTLPPELKCLILNATGGFGGDNGAPLGTLSLVANPATGEVDLTADYSAVGATEVRLELFINGLRLPSPGVIAGIAIGSLAAGPLGPPELTGCGKLPGGTFPIPQLPCYFLRFEPPGFFTIPGQAPVEVNEIRVLANNASGPVTGVGSLTLQGATSAGTSSIDILNISSGLPSTGGLTSAPLGQSELSRSGGRLVVSNIGSSGDDGVAIDFGESYFSGQIAAEGGLLVEGNQRRMRVRGEVAAGIEGEYDWITEVVQGDPWRMTADFSPLGASTHTTQLYLNGQLQFEQSGMSGPSVLIPPQGRILDAFGSTPDDSTIRIRRRLDQATPCTITGGPTIQADEIRFIAEGQTSALSFISQLDVTGMWSTPLREGLCPPIIVDSVGVGCHGVLYTADGNASLSSSGGELVVSNIGSSGLDGVCIDLVDALGVDNIGSSGLDGVRIGLCPVEMGIGDLLLIDASHLLNGAPNPAGNATLENACGTTLFTPDFSSIQSSVVRVEIYDDGLLVGSFNADSGAPAATASFAGGGGAGGTIRVRGCGKLGGIGQLPCFFFELDGIDDFGTVGDTVQFNPIAAGGTRGGPVAFFGDEIRLLATDAAVTIDTLTGFGLKGKVIPKLEIEQTAGIVLPDPCPCDWNADTNLNSDDFFAFLTDFFAGSADFDNNGTTNSDDFFSFLNCFFTPPAGC